MPESIGVFKKTRIAPTPSGFLHLGNVLSFALTAAIAQKTGAKILLRIDDLDRERVNKLYVQDIFDTLNFLEIPWDEGPHNLHEYESIYSQQHRMAIYQTAMQQLKESGEVFACQCSRAQIHNQNANDIYPGTCRNQQIPFETPDTAWRLHTGDKRELLINTLNDGLVKTSLPVVMQDFIVKKKDGNPSYQLASVIDDLFFGVDLVVRGEDLWPSTQAQHYLALSLQQAGFQQITFHHHSLLMEPSDKKLSKSAGATSVHYLREQGKKPAEIYSAIARITGNNKPINNWQQLAALLIN
ncbi:MAG: tRNA glutamyl-Q synthetase [Mucilaginibacter sp.]|nr:tRNA glutamyl-Q synthetase [Mucilaginibacter sp.]